MAPSLASLLLADADMATQLALAVIWGVVWHVMLGAVVRRAVKPWVLRQPWKDQWASLNRRTMENFGIKFQSDEHAFESACEVLAILGQHAIGGAMCLPSVLGARGPAAGAVARHGALCEVGWELQDLVQRLWQVSFGGEEGRAKNPRGLMVIISLHHALGLGLVLPMNMAYGDHPLYHEMVLLLQGAAFVAMSAQNYGFTLDVKTPRGLWPMRVTSALVLATMLWSRVLRYVPLACSCVQLLYSDGNTRILCAAGPALCSMGMVNLILVFDAANKCLKYTTMRLKTAEEQQQVTVRSQTLLQATTSPKQSSQKHFEQQALRARQASRAHGA